MDMFDKKPLSLRKHIETQSQPQSNDELVVVKKQTSSCEHNENCECQIVKNELTATLTGKNAKLADHRSRSKSEPRITTPITGNRTNSFTFFDDTETPSIGDRSNSLMSTNSTQDSTENLHHNHNKTNSHSNNNSKSMSLTRDITGIIGKEKIHDIKMYNTKTLPKRITNLRKRNKTTKETFKFYMDLPDSSYDTTVLRITESADNINEIKGIDDMINDNVDNNVDNIEVGEEADETIGFKRDSDIISDLLKDKNQCIERIRKKPPKKKSFDNGRICDYTTNVTDATNLTSSVTTVVTDTTTTPTNSTTQHQNDSIEASENFLTKLNAIQKEIHIPEPIYESLLRNVHVPYKYSPVLSRSNLHKLVALKQQVETKLAALEGTNEIKHPDANESDYVTLMFTDTGQMQAIGNTTSSVQLSNVIQKDDISLFRNSDSNINYNKLCRDGGTVDDDIDLMTAASNGNFTRRSSFNLKSSMNLIQRLISIKAEAALINGNVYNDKVATTETAATSKSINRLNERRISDVSEMFHQAFIHKQGSETLGSRIAQLDYADPKTLFTITTPATSQTNILINKSCNLKQERDSVFSLTSSNDSVNDGNKQQINEFHENSHSNNDNNDDEYEKNVEDSLETGIFRDSAIYSDDNVGRCENIYETPTDLQFYGNNKSIMDEQSISAIELPPPTPPPRNCPPKIPKKPAISRLQQQSCTTTIQPPPLPAKPSGLYSIAATKSKMGVSSICEAINEQSLIKADADSAAAKSWVSKQIKIFEN